MKHFQDFKKIHIFLSVIFFLLLTVMPAQTRDKQTQVQTPWPIVCKKSKTGKVVDCKMVQKILVKKTGKLLMQAIISKKKGKGALLLHLPTGLFLPAGIAIHIDKNKKQSVVIQTCDVRGCFAAIPVSARLEKQMKEGELLFVAFKNLKKQVVSVGLTLKGFSSSYGKI